MRKDSLILNLLGIPPIQIGWEPLVFGPTGGTGRLLLDSGLRMSDWQLFLRAFLFIFVLGSFCDTGRLDQSWGITWPKAPQG
jgi:hypothetical protein